MENKEVILRLAKRSEQIKKEQIEGCFDSLALNYLRAILSMEDEYRRGFKEFIKKYEMKVTFYDKYRKTIIALIVGLIIGLALTYFPVKMLQEETIKAYEAENVAKEAYSQLTQSISVSDNK